MNKNRTLIYSIIFFVILGCETNDEIHIPYTIDTNTSFDIILIVGQSNTCSGIGLDTMLDASDSKIKQLGRFGNQNLKIIEAKEPLHHHSKNNNKIGFGLTFSKLYIKHFENKDNEVLIIPCGRGGTSFSKNNWNKGDHLYTDAVSRVKHVRIRYPNSSIKAILWHQGESDLENSNYKNDLDTFISDLRNEFYDNSIPFILGGMVPYWVNLSESHIKQQEIISTTSKRLNQIGYADPTLPFLIEKDDNEFDAIHYNAEGQRELGKRYFQEYLRLYQE